ncbi:hypothetical protein HZA57_06555 [Candidatus Poribacteria bacterium]|nr:hypothetical protein [Candidatus Poribacteria bacterium]
MKKQAVDDILALVQNTMEQWLSFKKYLGKSFSEDEIVSEDETSFLEIKSSVARNIRTLGERVKEVENLDYGGTSIRDLLNKCVSVSHLRALPLNDRRALYKDWHSVFVRLSRTVGAFKFISEGYVPGSAGGKKGAKGKGKGKKGGNKTVMIVVVVLVLAGGAVGAAAFLGLL